MIFLRKSEFSNWKLFEIKKCPILMLDKERFLSQILSVFSNENCFKTKNVNFHVQFANDF